MNSFDSLIEEFRAKEGVANLFGVVLYTDEHPNIKKVLRDEDYWLSFHELTGDRFCVFSVKPAEGTYGFPTLPKGRIGMMVQIWKEPSENKKLLEVFELEDTEKLPILLLFTKIRSEYLKIELALDDTSQESAYSSIKEQLKFSCETLNQIKDENIKNAEGLYAAVGMRNDHRQQWNLLKRGVDLYAYFKRLLP